MLHQGSSWPRKALPFCLATPQAPATLAPQPSHTNRPEYQCSLCKCSNLCDRAECVTARPATRQFPGSSILANPATRVAAAQAGKPGQQAEAFRQAAAVARRVGGAPEVLAAGCSTRRGSSVPGRNLRDRNRCVDVRSCACTSSTAPQCGSMQTSGAPGSDQPRGSDFGGSTSQNCRSPSMSERHDPEGALCSLFPRRVRS